MKYEFWKEPGQLFIAIPVFGVCGLVFLILGIVYSVWILTVFATTILIYIIYKLIAPKQALTKVMFSEFGVEIKWIRKQILFITWSEIIEVKSVPWGKSFRLAFVTKNSKLEMEPRKKIYNAVMELCSKSSIKYQLQNDSNFNCYR